MAVHKWADIKAKKNLSPEKLERLQRDVDAEVLELDLAELRKALGKTQAEIAEIAEMTQSELSRIERRDDHRMSTLRRVVRACGGEVEVIAVVGGKRIMLHV